MTLVLSGTVAIGAVWWAANLGDEPAYGDTAEYWALSSSLAVDGWRTIGYPLALRVASDLSSDTASSRVLVYLAQTAVALLAIAYLVEVLDRTAGLRRSVGSRALLVGAVFAAPLIVHYSVTILTDSFATSFSIAALAAVTDVVANRARSSSTAAIGGISVMITGVIRPDRLIVLAVLIGCLLLVAALTRDRRAAATLLVIACGVPAALIANSATPTVDLGRGAPSWQALALDRAMGGRAEATWATAPDEFRSLVSLEMAREWDRTGYGLPIVLALQDRPDLAIHTAASAVRCCAGDLAAAVAGDLAEYVAAPFTYIFETQHGRPDATAWANSRMEQAHPGLTDLMRNWSAVLLIGLSGMVAIRWRRIWRRRATRSALFVLVLFVILTASMHGLRTGTDANIRYGLPIYTVWWVVILWAATFPRGHGSPSAISARPVSIPRTQGGAIVAVPPAPDEA